MEHLKITVDGKTYDVLVEKIDSGDAPARAASAAPAARAAAPAAPAPKPSQALESGDMASPLAGVVKGVEVAVGAHVNEGDLVITLEAMKMFTPINAPATGTVSAIHVSVGDAVEEGQPLFTIG